MYVDAWLKELSIICHTFKILTSGKHVLFSSGEAFLTAQQMNNGIWNAYEVIYKVM